MSIPTGSNAISWWRDCMAIMISTANPTKAIKQVFDAREKLFNRRIYAGTAISGTTAVGEFSLRQYPAPAVSIEDLSVKTKYLGKWLREPSQVVVDLSDKASREDLQSEIRLIWLHSVSRIRFIENAAVHPRVAALQKWSDYCDNMEGLGRIAESLKANVIFSIFMRPWEVNDKEMKQLISGVGAYNAIAMQIPWSKSIKEDTNAKNWAIYRYRQILDSNIVVILVPSDDAPIAELTKWVSTWRRPTDMIFYSQSSRSEPLV